MKYEAETAAPAKKEKTALRRQTVATVVLAGLLVLLLVAQIVASGLVKIYTLKDVYVDESGVVQTVKYKIKRDSKTGLYALYNAKGEQMQTAPDNGYNNYRYNGQQFIVYETEVGGNQYRINTSTGEYELYASVDAEGDELLGGTVSNTRLLMFPRIDETEFSSLEIENQTGKFCVKHYTNSQGSGYNSLLLWNGENWQQSAASINAQMLSTLRVNCGYTLTTQKLDLSSPASPRLSDGSVNYAAYGLDEGSTENPPAIYTITKNDEAKTSYTVLVGNQTVTGGGYYVKRKDKSAVYILDTGISAVLSPVESLVKPQAMCAMGETTYPMVKNFYLWKMATLGTEEEPIEPELITAFSYQDLSERLYTLYQAEPYVIPESIQMLSGYTISDWDITDLLSRFYRIQYLACKKLMPDYEDLVAYGLTENFHCLMFDYDMGKDQIGSTLYVRNTIYLSSKIYDEELGQEVCYLYSPQLATDEDATALNLGYDMIVAVDPYYVSFIDWEQSHWYDPYYFQADTAFLRELHLTFGEKEYDFYLDNSKTDQSVTLSAEAVEVTCLQYGGEDSDHKLDYEVHTVETTDIGTQSPLDYTGVQNFKRFLSKLFTGVIEGDINQAQFQAATGKTVEEFIASDTEDDQCIAKIRYHLEDYAASYNKATNQDGSPYWTKNNHRDIVLRFYAYESSGRKSLLTVEVLGNSDADQSDATRAKGLFYVNTAALGVFAGYAEDLLNQVLIPSVQ